MFILQNISYVHPDKELLFDKLDLAVNKHDKIALTGNNGTGKSTLLKIIAGELQPSAGAVKVDSKAYYVPQHFGQYNRLTIAQALQIHEKLQALKEILDGNVTENNLSLLEDDWTLEERCNEALENWQLKNLDLMQKMETLSGGQKTKVFLAGISIHQRDLVLLDEPSNHLDTAGRQLLYNYLQASSANLIVVSHDRNLLNLLDTVCELSPTGITTYGGNYDFYAQQKQMETDALNEDLVNTEKALRKAKEKARETLERQQRLDSRGRKKQEKAGVARIMMNTLRNQAENSTSKIKSVHTEKISGISQELQELRSALPAVDKMKIGFDKSALHSGKILFTASAINYGYNDVLLWKHNLSFQIVSGERIVLKG